MVEQVNRLIGNRLAAGGELFLPGIGSLRTERRGARRISRRMIEPPCRMVAFSSQQQGETLPALIARAASCDEAAAQDIYARYLEQSLVDGVLTVDGVGVLKLKHFRMDEAFDRRLNPQGHAPMRIRALHRFDWALWCGVAAIAFAVIFGGYQFLMLFPDQPAEEVRVADAGHDRTNTAVAADTPMQEFADSLTSVAGPGGPISAEGRAMSASGTERMASDEAATTLPTETDAQAARPEQRTDARQADSRQPAASTSSQAAARQPASSQSVGRQAASSETTLESVQQPVPAASDRPAPLQSGCKYVVLGVFSTPENAARAVRNAASATPSLPCRVYRFGGKYMVSPFESDDAAACARFIAERKGHYRDLWTYTAR